MSITIKLPTQLRDAAGGATSVTAEGATVGAVLEDLFETHGELRERLYLDGDLRRFVNVYLGEEDIRFLEGLDTELPDGSSLTILPAVAGG